MFPTSLSAPSSPPFPRHPWMALLVLMPSLAVAAEDTSQNPVSQFDTMTVTATRNEQPVGKVPSTVSVINERQIDQGTVSNVKDLVRYEPGVSVGGSGSRFGLSGFNIRGIDDNRVLTQIDGVSVPKSFSFGQFLDSRRDYIDVDTLKRVEIIRGPASSLYGSDALGGAVSFLTKDAGDYLEDGKDTYLRLKTGYDGSDNSWQRSATFAGRSGDFDGLLHLGRRTGDEADTFDGTGGIGAQRGDPNPVGYTSDNVLAKVGWNYGDGDRLQLTYDRYHDHSDTDVLSEYSTTAAIRTSDARDDVDRERISLQNSFQLDTAWADKIQWQLSHQDSDTRQQTFQDRVVGGGARYRTRDSHYEEKLWALTSQLDKHFELGTTQHQLTYGVDVKRTQNWDLREGGETVLSSGVTTPVLPTSDFPAPTTWEYAAYAQDSIAIGRWTLLPGLRYDYYDMKPDVTANYLNSAATDHNPPDYRDHALSPKFGVTYQIDDYHSVYGQYAAGFRAPRPVDIFGEFINPGLYRTLANPNLKAETSNSFETGLRGKYDSGSFGLALFYNRYKDFIEQVNRVSSDPVAYPFGDFQYVNRERVTIKGAEAKGELFLDAFGLPSGTRAIGSVAYARGEDDQTGQPLNSVDPLKGVFGLGYTQPGGKYGTQLTWTLVAAKHRIDDTETPTALATSGYGTLDLSGFWQVTQQVSINAGLFNIADKEYWQWGDVRSLTDTTQNIDRFSQPGRHMAVNLIWEL